MAESSGQRAEREAQSAKPKNEGQRSQESVSGQQSAIGNRQSPQASTRRRWRVQFHIFTGLVGPYMVLLHSSWKFRGLAGATTLLTIIIVLSGFVGRYIYTRIPRTIDGLEISRTLSEEALRQARRLLALWHTIHIPIGMALFVSAFTHIGAALYYVTLSK